MAFCIVMWQQFAQMHHFGVHLPVIDRSRCRVDVSRAHVGIISPRFARLSTRKPIMRVTSNMH